MLWNLPSEAVATTFLYGKANPVPSILPPASEILCHSASQTVQHFFFLWYLICPSPSWKKSERVCKQTFRETSLRHAWMIQIKHGDKRRDEVLTESLTFNLSLFCSYFEINLVTRASQSMIWMSPFAWVVDWGLSGRAVNIHLPSPSHCTVMNRTGLLTSPFLCAVL